MRLIDADALKQDIFNMCNCFDGVQQLVDEAPTVDAEPVRHGRWIPNEVGAVETKFECSECGRTVILCNDYFAKATKYASHRFPYCHCGCKMDAEVE